MDVTDRFHCICDLRRMIFRTCNHHWCLKSKSYWHHIATKRDESGFVAKIAAVFREVQRMFWKSNIFVAPLKITTIFACAQGGVLDSFWFVLVDNQYNHQMLSKAWWRHQMETFSASLAICAGNSPVPNKGQWRGALMFSLICARLKVG